jgi:hypothetical protein
MTSLAAKGGKVPSVRTPDARAEETIKEETLAAHSLVVKTRVDLGVKGVEKRTCDEVRRPNWGIKAHIILTRDERRLGETVDRLIEGGETRRRLATPPMEKPMSWVDMTRSHW